MSAGARPSSSTRFGVVGGPTVGEKQRRELVDEDELSEKLREGLEADDFVIYGKASVEQYDDDRPPQKLLMSAFEDEIERYIDEGFISRQHKDVKVGEPLREYTLDEATEVDVGDRVESFEAGDTLETHIDGDELWVVAQIYNDTELARDTRVGAMSGDLNGFSVTVFCEEWKNTSKGQEVNKLDWHSTTIGEDHQIKNGDSRFGVADYKAFLGFRDAGLSEKMAHKAAVATLRELPNMGNDNDKGDFWTRVKNVASQKADDGPPGDGGESAGSEADEKMDGEDGEHYDDEEHDEKASDAEEVIEKVEMELGEEDAEVLREEMGGGSDPEPPEPDEGDEESKEGSYDEEGDEEDDDYGELKADVADEVEQRLDEKMDGLDEVVADTVEKAVDEKLDDRLTAKLDEKLDERLPDEVASKAELEQYREDAVETMNSVAEKAAEQAAEESSVETAQKMETGGTPSPSTGTGNDEVDYKSEIKQRFGSS